MAGRGDTDDPADGRLGHGASVVRNAAAFNRPGVTRQQYLTRLSEHLAWPQRRRGFPEAIEAIYPQTTVQTCIVHLIRASLRYVPRRQYDAVVKDLKPIYTAINADQALLELDAFDQKWGQQLPVIGQAWRSAWEYVTPFMAFEPEVRRVIYTTNAIEALNRQLRKAVKTKGSFPTEDAARKLLFLAIQNAGPQWTRTRGWTKALLAFKIQFGDRLPD